MRSKIPLLALLVSALTFGPAGALGAADLGTAAANNLTTGNVIHGGGTAKKSRPKK